MLLHNATTLIWISAVIALLGVQCLFFWIRDRNAPWLGWFAAALICGSFAPLTNLFPVTGHEFLQFGFGNAVRILAYVFFWNGWREFGGRPGERLVGLFVVAAWLALCSLPGFLGSAGLRIGVATLCIVLFSGFAAWELWRTRDEGLPSLKPTVVTCVSYAIVTLLRFPLVSAAPFAFGTRSQSGLLFAALSLVAFVHATFIVGFALSLTRERREFAERRQALADPLTGLLNRRAYAEECRRLAERRLGRGARRTAVLVLDLDDFKAINDRHGHEAGDLVLQRFADVARANTRAGDLLYRMGGEEFCFVLPETGPEQARSLAERIRQRFLEARTDAAGRTIHATASIGIATTDQTAFDLDLLLAAADAAVYQAKRLGRNRTVMAEDGLVGREPGGAVAAA